MDTTRHQGKVAIVTGAANGIGRATVLRLASEGATVIGCDLNAEALAGTEQLLTEAGKTAQLVVADVTLQADVERVVAAAGGKIDILANVAGIMDHFVPLGDLDDALWERVMAVNVTGVMRLTRAVLPIMEAAGHGAIVTVASKHAVIGLIKSVAYFYGGKGIRSNAVLPGGVVTAIGASSNPQVPWAMERAQLSMATIARMADADEIATVISWLACDEASNVNGAVVSADGGWATA
jgi:NAD(P)-dependent dehydrogenase (short-subunit alcohol dehydrogenase family)